MKKPLTVISALTLVISASSAQSEPTTQGENVLAVVTSMTEALQNKNLQGILANYESEATIVFEPGTHTSDKKQIELMFKGFFDSNPVFTYSDHDIIIAGDLALHIAPWLMNGRSPDNHVITDKGLSVAVLRRQQSGHWKIVIDHPYGDALLHKR